MREDQDLTAKPSKDQKRKQRSSQPTSSLRARYAMSGTDLAYGATRFEMDEVASPVLCCVYPMRCAVLTHVLRIRFAVSGTDISYATAHLLCSIWY
eukprot:3630069-Rhodomonas_salina.2